MNALQKALILILVSSLVYCSYALGSSERHSISDDIQSSSQESMDVPFEAETVTAVPATVEWAFGTTPSGDISDKVIYATVGYNTTYPTPVNVTIFLHNATTGTAESSVYLTLANNLSEAGVFKTVALFPRAYAAGATYYLNFTIKNTTNADWRSSTQTYYVKPVYGSTKTQYGSYILIDGAALNNTLSAYKLYYPQKEIVEAYASSSTSTSAYILVKV